MLILWLRGRKLPKSFYKNKQIDKENSQNFNQNNAKTYFFFLLL